MDDKDIEILARGPKESAAVLSARMSELKAQGATILECILYVKRNQQCSLTMACDFVINSAAWIDQKDSFLQHQADMMQEFVEDNIDQIESIEQTYSAEGTKTTIHMKHDH
jgi:hypothetical protein